jgi:site-specific DNA recombinase
MSRIQPAIYARVSSEQQAQAHTIDSQIAALRDRVAKDGWDLSREMEFIDEGYSGSTLVRPALERLRDMVAAGVIDRLYVHSPDRLARKYAYQVLLVDEFRRSGIEVIFLNRELGQTPEDDLLLQVQGMIAEYERAKIIERNRRGRRHAARSGSVNALSGAPYGYRYIRKQEGGGQAGYEIDIEEARVVRQIFQWVVKDRVTIGEVCRRLANAGEKSRKGNAIWDRTVVWGVLKNPAYIGEAGFGKTRNGPLRPRLRAQRGRPVQPRRACSVFDVAREEWISIPVPSLVDREIFEAAQAQLRENQRQMREGARGASYLLQGVIVCKLCSYAFCGKRISKKAPKGRGRPYDYYRCVGTDSYRFGGHRVCDNHQLRTDLVDLAVWQEVRTLLEHPARVTEEYRRRMQPEKSCTHRELASAETRLSKLRHGLARLIDSYADGLIEKTEFEPRIKELRERSARLENQAKEMANQAMLESELRLIVSSLEQFVSSVKGGLDQADWMTKRDLIRALVKRVEVEKGQVNVVFRVDPLPFDSRPERGVLQHCWWRNSATLGHQIAIVPTPTGLWLSRLEC